MRKVLCWWFPALVALLLSCSQAKADFTTYAGDFVYGDDINGLPVILSTTSGRYDLTGTTVTLLARTSFGGRSYDITIAGQLVDPVAGYVVFPDVGAVGRNPGSRKRDTYNARVRIVSGAGTAYSNAFTFTVSVVLP